MALEAFNKFPSVVTDLEFKSMMKIPMASKGEMTSMMCLDLKDEDSRLTPGAAFVVKSHPSLRPRRSDWFSDEEFSQLTEHCAGKIHYCPMLTEDGRLSEVAIEAGTDHFFPLQYGDIGREGIQQLIEDNYSVGSQSKEHAYGTINMPDTNYYGPAFQLVHRAATNPVKGTILAEIEFDNSAWERQGGVYAVQLLDSMLHTTFVALQNSDPLCVSYAGGAEAGYFVRKPTTSRMYIYRVECPLSIEGRKSRRGDIVLYDEEGRLICFLKGVFSVLGRSKTTLCLSVSCLAAKLLGMDHAASSGI
jgi:hypothetical protein